MWVCVCVCLCVLFLTQIIALDKSPKYSCSFPSPYGYLGQLVLFYILVNLSCYYYCIMLGTNKVVVVVVVVLIVHSLVCRPSFR